MRLIFIASFGLCGLLPEMGLAKSIEGVVRSSGSHVNYRVIIQERDSDKSHTLCPGTVAEKLDRYHRLTAKVDVGDAAEKDGCLTPASFSLVKMPGGREPVFGALKKEGTVFSITANGTTYILEDIPKKLSTMENQEVVVDLAPSLSKEGVAKKLFNVTYFAPAP